MTEPVFFDANCRVGDTTNVPCPGVTELLGEMDRYGVAAALVRHGNLDDGSAPFTNAELARMLMEQDRSERLTGVWCILPEQCGELPPPDEFFSSMADNRIGALTLQPFVHRWIPCRLTIGKLMDAAAERRVPILLNAFARKWNELYGFLEEFPDNICVYVESVGKWGIDRQIRPLLEHYDNFYFETAGYWIPEGIRDLAEKYGADRILYGSNFPQYNQSCSMLQLKHSGLDAGSVARIAGGNLERLIKGAQLK